MTVDPEGLQGILSQPAGTFTHAMFAPKSMSMSQVRELFEFEVTNQANNIPPATKVISRSASNHPDCDNGPAQVTETLRDLNKDNTYDNSTNELIHTKIICKETSFGASLSMSLTYVEDASCASQRRTMAETADGPFDLGCYVESQREYYDAAEDVLRMSLAPKAQAPHNVQPWAPLRRGKSACRTGFQKPLMRWFHVLTSSRSPQDLLSLPRRRRAPDHLARSGPERQHRLDEIVSREEICHGERGQDGQDAVPWLLSSERFESSLACTGSGIHVLSGPDGDRDGALSSDEVSETVTVCDGISGAQGEGGANGTSSLVEMANTTMPGCVGQAIRIVTGLDLDGDGELDMEEYTSSRKVCVNSNQETEQIWVTEELPANAVCPNGMQRVYVWVDADGNGTLDEDEIQRELIQCSTVSEPVSCDASDDADGDCLQDVSDSTGAVDDARAENPDEDDDDFDGVVNSEDEWPDCDDNAPDMNGDGQPDVCEL